MCNTANYLNSIAWAQLLIQSTATMGSTKPQQKLWEAGDTLVLPESDWPQWNPANAEVLNQATQLFNWICILFEMKENLKLQKENEDFLDYSSTSLFKETDKHTERDLTSQLVMNFASWSSWSGSGRTWRGITVNLSYTFSLILPKCHFWHIILDYTNQWSKLVLHWFLEILFLEISADQMPLLQKMCA